MGAAEFFQTPRGARSARPIGFIGQVLTLASMGALASGINEDGQAKQVTTVAIPASPDNDEAYSVTVNGVTATYTSDASATQAEVGAGLEAAIEAAGGIGQLCRAAYSGGTLTLTGKWPGVSFTVTAAGGTGGGAIGTPSTTTSAAAADAVEFGLALVSDGFVADEATRKVKVPTAAEFTAQVITFTYDSVGTGDEVFAAIEFNGQRYEESVTYATSQEATLTALVAALDVILDAAFGAGRSIDLASDATTITMTADIAGAEFEGNSSVSGAGTVSKAYTTPRSVSTSLALAFIGMSARRTDVENQTRDGADPAYGSNEGVEFLGAPGGEMVVQRDTAETWSYGDQLYVSLASATKGRLYNTAGADRVWLGERLVALRQEPSGNTDGLAVVHIIG